MKCDWNQTPSTATSAKAVLPASPHTPAKYDGPSARRSARDAAPVSDTGPDHLLPRALDGRRGPHAVRLGRDRQAIPRRLRRDRDGLGRALPSTNRRESARAGGPASAYDDDLSCTLPSPSSAEKLAGLMPEASGLSVSYFTNSGSEANEIAILSLA